MKTRAAEIKRKGTSRRTEADCAGQAAGGDFT